MINNHYQLYVDNVLNLAETIVIKFDASADAINQYVIGTRGAGAVDEYNKYSWKYYQNISGQYHFTDNVIQINSLDVIGKIDLTVENLAIHKATREAYSYGSRYYRDLLQQYPDQELLILGILYPCDIDKAIDAVDGTILHYPAKYVEHNEYTFIYKLQDWIYKYLDRWVNKQFLISDNLYAATFIGQLYLHMVQAIFNIRLDACKTNEVHSFHIQQYLASHGMLDGYLTSMTRDQALFFYRNILYIQRNAGKRDTFDWLVEKIMTRRNLPLYEYSMSHDISQMRRVSLEDNASLQPEIMFRRKAINPPASVTDENAYTLPQVFSKVQPLALGNARYQEDHGQAINDALADSVSSVKATKMLESSVVDYGDAVPYTLESILFNHWLYLAAIEKLTATVLLSIPKNGTSVRLDAQDTVALFLYALSNAVTPDGTGLGLQRIPNLCTQRVVRTPAPSLQELRAVTSRDYVSTDLLTEIHATQVSVPTLVSIDAFYLKCKEIFTASALQYALYASQENQHTRGQAQLAVARLHSDQVVQLPALRDPLDSSLGMHYTSWLTKTGLDFAGYTHSEFYELALAIATAATGIDTRNDSSLKEIQKAMVSLFTTLSSYSIQMVSEINTSSILIVPHPQLRVGNTHLKENTHEYVDTAPVRVTGSDIAETQNYVFDLDKVYPIRAPLYGHSFHDTMDLPVKISASILDVPHEFAHLDTGLTGYTTFNFTESVHALSTIQRYQLVDTYCDCPLGIPTDDSRLNGFMLISHVAAINAFDYLGGTLLPVLPGHPSFQALNAFTLISRTESIDAFHYSGKNHVVDLSKTTTIQLDAFALLSNTKAIDAFHYTGTNHVANVEQANAVTLDAFTLVNHVQAIDAFHYSGSNSAPVLPGRPTVQVTDAFTLVSNTKAIEAFQYSGENHTALVSKMTLVTDLDAFALVNHVQAIDAFHYSGSNHLADPTQQPVTAELTAFTYVGRTAAVDAFRHSGGLFIQDFVVTP